MLDKEEIFRKIVDENETRIKGICRYYSINSEDHKDMYQEVLINIWKSLESFRGDANINTWVYRVTVNTAIGFVSKEIRRQKLIIDHSDQTLINLVDNEDYSIENKEQLFQALENQINQLSVVDKIIITLVLEL